MTPLGFAWRSLTRRPARAALGVAGITAVGALLFDMLLLSRGIVVSFRELLDATGYDVRVTATEALPTLGPRIAAGAETVSALRALPELRDVVPLRFGAVEPACAGQADDEPCHPIGLIGTDSRSGGRWRILSGNDLPQGGLPEPPAIVVNRNLARTLAVAPGAALRLRARHDGSSVLPPVEFRVAGIAEFPFDTGTEWTAATTLSAFFRVTGEEHVDEVDLILAASDPSQGADAAVLAIRRLRPDLYPFSNAHLIARFQTTDFSYFRQIAFVLSTITLSFAGVLVASLLTVSVNQRFAEIAAMRALGFSRGRVVAELLCESALLVGAGGLAALPVGGLLARQLDQILRTMPGIPERLHFFVFQPRAVVLYLMLLAGTGLLAALYPVYLAARLPIAATLRKEVVS